MKVKFIKDYENAVVGNVGEVDEVMGKTLIEKGIAELVNAEKVVAEINEKSLSVAIADAFTKMNKVAPQVNAEIKKKSFGELLKEVATKTVNITTAGQGGYATTPVTDTSTIDIVKPSSLASFVKRFSFNGTDNRLYVNLLTSVGTAPAIVAEDNPSTPSQPVLSQVAIEMKKLMYTYLISREALEDTGLLQELVNQAVQSEFTKYIETKIMTGTYATDGFEGIIGATDTYSVAKESGQAAGTIVPENIFKMFNALKNKEGACWVVSRTAYSAVMNLKTSSTGYPLFTFDATKSPNGMLLGLPVVVSDVGSAALGTVGDIVLANFATGYTMVQKFGLNVAATDDLYFLYDQRAYKFTYRMGGKITSKKLQLADNSYVADFISLQTRS